MIAAARRACLVSETARTGRKRRFCARIGTQSTHFRDRAPLPRSPIRAAPRRRPPRARAARAAAVRARRARPHLGADRARPRRRALRVPVRADRPRRTQRVDRRPGQPAAAPRARGATSPCGRSPATSRRSGSRTNRSASRSPSRSRAGSSRPSCPRSSGRIPTRPSAARCSSPTTGRSTPSTRRSLTLLGQLPPLRAALIGPVDRNEIYSASARYARALAEEILPGAPARTRPDRARRQPRRARALPHAPPPPGELRRPLPPVGQLLPPRRELRAELPALRADRTLRRRRPPQPARAGDPGRARLRHRRGEPGPRTGRSRSRSAAAATTRACTSSATVTTGSRGATPSTRTCAACSQRTDLNRRHDSLWSPAIGADGRVIAYGHWGRPLLAFPSQEGPAWQYEERGMIDAIGDLIEAGRVKVYAVDSFDSGSWYREGLSLEERAQLHGRYEDWILNQVVPFIQADSNDGRDHRHRRQLRRLPRRQLRAPARARLPARDLPERRLRRLRRGGRRARRRRLLQQPGRLRPRTSAATTSTGCAARSTCS